jgi:hypothetical protein
MVLANLGSRVGDVFWLAVFILLEKSSSLRRIFIGSHSLPSSLVVSSVFQVVSEPFTGLSGL